MIRAELDRVQTIVSHADCPDGIASALVLHDALPAAEICFLEHGTPEYAGFPARPGTLFCDIAPPRERVAEFVAAETLVLDHHRGARDVVDAFGARGVFADEGAEPGVSGALLAYRHVWAPLKGNDEAVCRFATVTGVRDTWQKKHPDWNEACAQAAALLFFGYEGLSGPRLSGEQLAVGRRLVSNREATAIETAEKKLHFLGPDLAVYNDRDRLLSDVAEAALSRHRELQIVCGFHYKTTSDGRMLLVAALRSRRGGIDVAALARRHGGGGHASAAGFSLPVGDHSPDPLTAIRRALD